MNQDQKDLLIRRATEMMGGPGKGGRVVELTEAAAAWQDPLRVRRRRYSGDLELHRPDRARSLSVSTV